jgi:hypothetical protein
LNEFRRKKEDENVTSNIDDEIQKIIAESLTKAKGSAKTGTVINPYQDLKKKDMGKVNTNKMKIITKQQNKVVVREVDKDIIK